MKTGLSITTSEAVEVYDVVVIGAGSGGLTAAVGFAKLGKKVLLIERDHLGGECTNSGCIPSKALLHCAKSYHRAHLIAGKSRRSATFRNHALTYVHDTIAEFQAEETPAHFEKMGITVIMGEARFVDAYTITVADHHIQFEKAVIATGSSPRSLTIPGLPEKDALTNQNLFALTQLPKKLLVIGSGPIGLEMGEAFALLGTNVTIATIDDRLAKLEDPAVEEILATTFAELGIEVELNVHIQAVENGKAVFDRLIDGTTTESFSLSFEKILVAIGRVPNLPSGLEAADILSTPHGIAVDSQFRTSQKHIFAIGDVAERLKFTHTADDAARQIVTAVASRGLWRVTRHKSVPKVTYTDPEMAQVGLSWSEASARYNQKDLLRIEVPLHDNDRARTDNATDGLLIVTARRLTGRILGASLIGPGAGELISYFSLAIDQKISLWKLRSTIFPYPTYSLLVKKAGDVFLAEQSRTLKADLRRTFFRLVPKLILALIWLYSLIKLYALKEAHGMDVLDTSLMVFDFISMTVWGILIYIGVYAVRPLTFFPGTALTILSGVFFGFWGGVIFTIIGANLSAALAYGVGRYFGNDINLEESRFANWIEPLQQNTFLSVLIMRLIFLPFDGVNYFSGILKLPFLPYALATLIGTLLGIATFVSIGASVSIAELRASGLSFEIINPLFVVLSAGVFLLSLGLSRLATRQQKSRS